MRNPRTSLFYILTILVTLSLGSYPSWGEGSEPVSGNGASAGLQPVVKKTNPSYNDYALFIAGISHPESSLAAYQTGSAWLQFSSFMNQRWEGFQKSQLAPMTEWASRELSLARTTTAFYPFSGADFVNVYTLFPHARTYLMVALEPVGELPDFSALEQGDFFASLQRSLYAYLYIDYFSTARMEASMAKAELKGVLPVLLFFLAREKARVLDIRYCVMKPDGAMEKAPAAGGESPGPGIPGVRIVFAGPGSTENQTIYYFQCNLQNGSLSRKQQFVSFLKSFGPLTTFTKSASYLLFSPYSSDIRELILDRSQYVLQDDSGIPLKYFDPAVWNLKFYGAYSSPTSLFKNRRQDDLAEVYNKRTDVNLLPFGIGYHYQAGTSNLIFASKKANLGAHLELTFGGEEE